MDGRGITEFEGQAALEIHIGNFANGKKEGWGLNIIITDHTNEAGEQNPKRVVECQIGVWKSDEFDKDATKEAEK